MASRKEEIRMQRIALRFLSGIFMASEQELPVEVGKISIPRSGAGDASTLSDDAGLDVSGIGTTPNSVGSGASSTSGAAFSSGAFAAVSAGPTLLLPSVDEFLRGSAAQNRKEGAVSLSSEYTTNAIRLAGKEYQYTRRPAMVVSSSGSSTHIEAVAKKRHGERIKAWQKDALSKGLHRGRLFLSAQSSYPVLCYSVMNYDASTERAAKRKRDILKNREAQGLAGIVTVGRKGRIGVSYIDLLGGDRGRRQSGIEAEETGSGLMKKKNKMKELIGDESISLLRDDVGKKKKKSKDSISANGPTAVSSLEGATELNKGMAIHYDPNFLDDGMIKQGKSRLITSGPSYRQSFLPYVKRRQLKDEINAQFRELHPWLPTSMSLSKIRTLKQESLEQWKKFDLELSTLALGIVYFERLVIKTLVMKTNRKLKFAACLLLAFKFNEGSLNELELADAQAAADALMSNAAQQVEVKTAMSVENTFGARMKNKKKKKDTWSKKIWWGKKKKKKKKKKKSSIQVVTGSATFDGMGSSNTDDTGSRGGTNSGAEVQTNARPSDRSVGARPTTLKEIFDSIERALGVTKKELFKVELQVFAELDFDLAVPPEHLLPHFVRLLDGLELTPREYLGEKLMRNYFQYDEEDEDEDIVVVTVDRLGDEDGFMSVDFAPEEQQMRGEENIDIQAYDVHSFHVENGANENKSSMHRSLTTIHAGRHSEGEWTNVSDQFDCNSGVGMIAI